MQQRRCGSTRTPELRHSDKRTTSKRRGEGDRCHDPCARRRNDTVARNRPVDVPRAKGLSDGLRDAIEWVSGPADELTRWPEGGNDGSEHQTRYNDSSNGGHDR
jgi:hypothetical protein